jgi:hypothetical protein
VRRFCRLFSEIFIKQPNTASMVKPTLGFRELLNRAEAEIESLALAEVAGKLTYKRVVLVALNAGGRKSVR